MTTQPKALNLARMRSEFEHWRSDGSGRGRIPERLWRAALADAASAGPDERQNRVAA